MDLCIHQCRRSHADGYLITTFTLESSRLANCMTASTRNLKMWFPLKVSSGRNSQMAEPSALLESSADSLSEWEVADLWFRGPKPWLLDFWAFQKLETKKDTVNKNFLTGVPHEKLAAWLLQCPRWQLCFTFGTARFGADGPFSFAPLYHPCKP